MSNTLLKKVQVVSGKTAGIIARETLAVAKRASRMPDVIKAKATEAIQVTEKTLKVGRLSSELKKRQQQRLAIFTALGKAIFKAVGKKERNIRQKKDIKSLVRELGKCEAEIEWIRAQINEVEERNKEQGGYREALLGLSSKEKAVRLAALKTLSELGDKEVIPILIKKLKCTDLQVRHEIVRVLHKIIDQEYRV